MSIDYGNIMKAIYDWGITDKVIHNGNVTKAYFANGETITGGTSGRTATITAIYDKHFNYALTDSNAQFIVGEIITGGTTGANCAANIINQFHTTINNNFFNEEAPEVDLVSLLPFVVFDLNTFSKTSFYTGNWETLLLSFNTYSEQSSSTQITLLSKQITDIFDKAAIPASNVSILSCLHTNTSKIFKDSNKIWGVTLDYELVVQ